MWWERVLFSGLLLQRAQVLCLRHWPPALTEERASERGAQPVYLLQLIQASKNTSPLPHNWHYMNATMQIQVELRLNETSRSDLINIAIQLEYSTYI